MTGHPNTLVDALGLIGKGIADLCPAYPGRDEAGIDALLRDCALALSRPVLPYGLLGIHPCRTAQFNVHEAGFRFAAAGQDWPPPAGVPTVFTFGGSTMVGFNVSDDETIPAALRRRLRARLPDCEVYNFASGSYTSRNELVRYLDLLDRGIRPDVALFLDGYNDSFYAFGNDRLRGVLDDLYQAEKRRRRKSWLGGVADFARTSWRERRRPAPSGHNYRADTALFESLTSAEATRRALSLSEEGPNPAAFGPEGEQVARLVWTRYLESVAAIDAVARQGGTRPLFAWQPQPYVATSPGQRSLEPLYELFPAGTLAAAVYHWLAAEGFPGLPPHLDFHDLSDAARGLDAVCYLDVCHYTGAMSERIAERLTGPVLAALTGSP